MSISGQHSASIFHTSGRCCASLAGTGSAAAASSPPADRPSPASQRAKAPTSPATPLHRRANQWEHIVSSTVTVSHFPRQMLIICLFACLQFSPCVTPGSLFRHGGGELVSDARQPSVVQWLQTGAPYQPEVKGKRSQRGEVWEDRRPQPHRPSHMSPLTDHSEYLGWSSNEVSDRWHKPEPVFPR